MLDGIMFGVLIARYQLPFSLLECRFATGKDFLRVLFVRVKIQGFFAIRNGFFVFPLGLVDSSAGRQHWYFLRLKLQGFAEVFNGLVKLA